MTISSEVRKAGPYDGNDVTTSFPFSFKVFSADDVVVVLTDPAGIETTLTGSGTDYSVTLNADQDTAPGGTVEKVSALATDYLLTITSSMPNLQPLDLTNQGGFYPKVINAALDRVTILVQQVAEQVGRAVKVPISSGLSPDNLIAEIKTAESNANIAMGTAQSAAQSAENSLSNLAAITGAGLVGFMQSGSGVASRTVLEKLRETRNILDYAGATANEKIDAMVADVGYVVFPTGNHVVSTMTIDAPIFFGNRAYVTVNSGNTLTISGGIESPRQWIFRGAGDYILTHDSNSGEDSRQVHATWFGAFPSTLTDQSVAINRAFAAMGNLRESVVEFDVGNYYISNSITVTRGGCVKGQGSRRTVFNAMSDGFAVFATNGEACRFEGIQFEHQSQLTVERASPWISILHSNCEIKDVFAGRAFRSFLVTGGNLLARDIGAFYNVESSAGSSLFAIQASSAQIYDVRLNTSSGYGPAYVVHVGADLGAGSATISGTLVRGINGSACAMPVFIEAAVCHISRTLIDGVLYNAFAGSAPEAVIKLKTSATWNIEDVGISNVISNSHPSNGIVIEQGSSGTTFDIRIDDVTISGTSGAGISFIRTNGFLKQVFVDGGVDVKDRATPYSFTGSNIIQVKIDPIALPNALPAACYDFTIADDSVGIIELRRSVHTAWLMVTVGSTERGIYFVRAASSPAISAYGSPTGNMSTATTALNGTSGTDTKFTVGVVDGRIYLENRLGSSQRVSASLLTGVI